MCGRTFVFLLLVSGLFCGMAQAQLITAVAHRNLDADAPEDAQIAGPLDEGALTFVDRTHVYADVPEWLIGAEYVMLANDNKNMSAYELDITFSKNATLYVFVDNRMGGSAGGKDVDPIVTGMPWLADMGFVDIGEDIGIDESNDGSINQYYSIFALDVKAGTVTIFGNTEGHSGNMLGVAALPRAGGDKAQGPVPEDGATDIPRDTILGWTAGDFADTHNVYLGLDLTDVNTASAADPMDILVSEGQMDTTYDPAGGLAYGKTYYWRIDEVNAPPDSTVFKGDVWSFTVEPYAYPIENITATASSSQANMGPEKTIDGSGLDGDQHSVDGPDMWLSDGVLPNWIQYEFDKAYKLYELRVWNSNQVIESFIGFGAKDVTIEYSTDGETWTELPDVPEFAKATAMPTYVYNTTVSFGGVVAQYVRLTIDASWGGLAQVGLAEVQFSAVPVQAREPEPADGATGVAIDAVMNWRPGREAASHTVYFGTDADAVAAGTATAETVTDHSFTPADMDYATTYYWRVDEANEAMDPSLYEGDVWSFSASDYGIVDDFEDYDDDIAAETTIWQIWIDGLTDEASGSQVGYIDAVNGTFGEKTIVNTGSTQSMPITYDNTGSFSFSEVARTFDGPQDWTANGIKTLSLYFYGAADNGGQLYLKINTREVLYSGDAGDIAIPGWRRWTIDLSTVNTNLSNVTKLTIGIKGAGTSGVIYIDDIRVYGDIPEPPKAQILWVSFHEADETPSSGAAGAGFTEAPDKAYTDLLEANGYEVTRYVQTGTPDLDIVNNAGLVIISRSVASGSFQGASATTWNGVFAPMINLNGYTIRSSRLGFSTGTTIPDTTGDITLTVNDATHPIFAGISLTAGRMTNPYAGVVTYPDGTVARGISIVTDPPADTGTVLATVSAGSSDTGPVGAMVIAEWPAGATVTHDGGAGTDVLSGHRLVFLTGAREADGISSETAGLYDLYDDGAQMFLNAVAYMLDE